MADELGVPIAGARLTIVAALDGSSVAAWVAAREVRSSPPDLLTDSAGVLRLEGLPRGSYEWRAEDQEGRAAAGSAEVRGGEQDSVRACLR